MAKDKKKKEKSSQNKNIVPLNLTELLKEKEEQLRTKELDFNAIKISISSPEMIRQRSRGEVKKPETINYRTFNGFVSISKTATSRRRALSYHRAGF